MFALTIMMPLKSNFYPLILSLSIVCCKTFGNSIYINLNIPKHACSSSGIKSIAELISLHRFFKLVALEVILQRMVEQLSSLLGTLLHILPTSYTQFGLQTLTLVTCLSSSFHLLSAY